MKRVVLASVLIPILLLGLTCLGQAAPMPANLALSGTASQSSDYSTAYASRAIDGITNGNYFDGSVSHTSYDPDPYAWWKVDLLDEYTIGEIVIWNRTDGWGYRLSDFNVSVLGEDGLSVAWSQNYHIAGGPAPSLSIDLPSAAVGQFVKIQLTRQDYLQLAEVQVFGAAPVPVPGAILLLTSGLIGIAGMKKMFGKR